MALSAASKRLASSLRLAASTGTCSATSSATACAEKQVGPTAETNTSRARPPIRAERMTFASATTAGGSEIAQDLFLGHASRLALSRDLLGQPEEHLASHIRR